MLAVRTWQCRPKLLSAVFDSLLCHGCCLQGWPKLVQAAIAYALQPEAAIVVNVWGPVQGALPHPIGGGGGVEVDTEYPFGDTATVTVTANLPVALLLRMPAWAQEATVAAGGAAAQAAAGGAYFRVPCGKGTTVVTVDFMPQAPQPHAAHRCRIRAHVGWVGTRSNSSARRRGKGARRLVKGKRCLRAICIYSSPAAPPRKGLSSRAGPLADRRRLSRIAAV